VKRGDIVLARLPGDFGKLRPAVVVQSDRLIEGDSVILCPLTSYERDAPFFRLTVHANDETGLREISQVMVEKIGAVRPDRCGRRIGRASEETLLALDRLLAFVLGLSEEPAA
jgi:mRNA interferase MazF